MPLPENSPPPEMPQRIMAAIFGIAFGGIGLTVLGFNWNIGGNDGFGDPPVFFKLFASLISLPFIGFGVAAVASAISGKQLFTPTPKQRLSQLLDELETQQTESAPKSPVATVYSCPNCSAPLKNQADVSPHGDVKCDHCNAWFNIYKPAQR